jgi:hypothetical protein
MKIENLDSFSRDIRCESKLSFLTVMLSILNGQAQHSSAKEFHEMRQTFTVAERMAEEFKFSNHNPRQRNHQQEYVEDVLEV